jgi:hypothetical protein
MILTEKHRNRILRSLCDSFLSQGYNRSKVLSFLSVKNQELCLPPLASNILEEIVDSHLFKPSNDLLISFGNFNATPDYRSVLLDKTLVFELTERQSWVLKWLISSLEQGVVRIPQRSIRDRLFQELSDIYESEGRDFLPQSDRLRDWVFRAGNSGDLMWGTLIKTTKGRDSRIYLDLNWLPDSSFFKK